jgi:hypothetical protein
MASVAQVRANRLNARKSTGPRTPEGKAVVAQNAVKHGLLARQVVIRGEDPGEFELFRDRMVQDLDPVGSLESLLAERVAHLGWRLRRAERLDRAAWATLETDYAAREASTPPALRRRQGEAQDEEEAVLARVVVDDFGRAKLLERLLGYERRIENSLYRTVNELRKQRLVREVEEVSSFKCQVSSEQSQLPGARRLPTEDFTFEIPPETPCSVTTNAAESEEGLCQTEPMAVAGDKWQVTRQEAPEASASELATSNGALQTADTSGETNPICGGGSADRETCTETQEVGRGRPSYEEAPCGEVRETKPNEATSEKSRATGEPG